MITDMAKIDENNFYDDRQQVYDPAKVKTIQKSLRLAFHPGTGEHERAAALNVVAMLDPNKVFIEHLDVKAAAQLPEYHPTRVWRERLAEKDAIIANANAKIRKLKNQDHTIEQLREQLREAKSEAKKHPKRPPQATAEIIGTGDGADIDDYDDYDIAPKTKVVRMAIRPLIEAGKPINQREWADKLDVSIQPVKTAVQFELGRLEGLREGGKSQAFPPQTFPLQHTIVLYAIFGDEHWQADPVSDQPSYAEIKRAAISWKNLRENIINTLLQKHSPDTVEKWLPQSRKSAHDTVREINRVSAETRIPYLIVVAYENRESSRRTGSAKGLFSTPAAFPGCYNIITPTDCIELLHDIPPLLLKGFTTPPANAHEEEADS